MEADVGILRQDFKKLSKILENELPSDIFFQTKDTDPDYLFSLFYIEAKLRDKYSTYIKFQENNSNIKWHNGIQVDIFVYDIIELEGQLVLINSFERTLNGGKSYLIYEEIKKLESTAFEDTFFYIPTGYDTYLERNYGNYRQLPDENLRTIEEVDVFTP